ncbi:hypothetical protein B0T17DRAFT_530619 [Bombardia bombarda]|uniref:Uncharacterized protein n=1 Tax=Bombardia bombarda TaxID=252184 RepID=A0AA40C4D4_9PEZI|nr:hypothetical protein B0T17DRAFT_530619 [Bombardia bombarda]
MGTTCPVLLGIRVVFLFVIFVTRIYVCLWSGAATKRSHYSMYECHDIIHPHTFHEKAGRRRCTVVYTTTGCTTQQLWCSLSIRIASVFTP